MSMPSGDQGCRCQSAGPSAADANDAIRAYVTSVRTWTPEALAELDELRRVWAAAVARERLTTAA